MTATSHPGRRQSVLQKPGPTWRHLRASRFWQTLARATDPAGSVRVPEDLRGIRYPGSQKPIVEDHVFHGAPLLKTLLEELDRADDVVSRECGRNPLDWSEARQRSPENNRYIWNAVINVSQRFSSDSRQLKRMVETLGHDAGIRLLHGAADEVTGDRFGEAAATF